MKKRRYMIMVGLVFSLFVLLVSNAWAQDSVEIISYQGNLKDNDVPMNGTVAMTFAIFDTQTPGSDPPLWSGTHSGVQISDGIFNVHLGSVTPFPADLFDTYDNLYLRITVGGETLTPLQQLTATPYAMKADTANHAHTATAADSVLNGTVTGDLLVDGRVGVGDAAPGAELHVVMTPGSMMPSLTPGLIVEDVASNSGSRLEIRDENGVAAFRIDASGDVDIGGDARMGIGIANPQAQLHLVMPNGSLFNPSTIGGLIITDSVYNSGNRMEIQDHLGNAGVVVDEAGQVGIGTIDPQARLDINGTTRTSTLEVDGGEIRVSGAGGNTSTPVFRHVPSLSNSRCDISGHACHETTIDHPMTNGDPSAILIITPNGTDRWYSDSTTPRVKYDYTEQKWKIYMNWWDLPNLSFNVLVVKN